ncbi:hypothetical protein L3X38_021778 [Prunus dulcis]|uniref:CCHC-type domain-containing protein n=1 Tax=Prunus dulcis TaxID=3755 RepID=A0AAD4VXG7_PRUDU|nr:hypothetical protein L3X38_021778 [Prunus dulcis]
MPKTASPLHQACDKSKVQCFNCQKFGHYQNECNSLKFENKGHHAKFAENDNGNEETLLLAFNVVSDDEKNKWLFDTGCSNHMCGHKDLFNDLNEFVQSVITFGD